MKKQKGAAAKAEKPKSAAETFRESAHPSLTRRATWIQYSPGARLIRVNVEEVLETKGQEPRILRGHDVDIPVDQAGADILAALTDALSWAAEDLGATVYEPPDKEE